MHNLAAGQYQTNKNLETLKLHKNQLFFSGSAVIFTTLLGLFTINFLHPFSFTENTNATTERTTNGDYYIETTTTDLNLTINTTPAGAQETASHDITVKTDDPAGYTLTVSVNNDTSNALNLNGSTSATEKFNATSGTYASPKALDENSWGFADTLAKKNNDTWAAVPLLSNAQQIKQTSSANTSGDTTTVHYSINAKYDGAHSNGNYSNTITYSTVGNTPPTPNTLDDITYMQDVYTYSSIDLCGNSTIWTSSNNKEYTLKDSRDNLEYKVRKLADGNCWMAQNLRMTADTLSANSHSTTLTSEDTDLAGSYTYIIPNNTQWIYTSLTTQGAADATKLPVGSSSGSKASSTTAVARGAYYSWSTATARTGSFGANLTATTSICPKGWQLPMGGNATSHLYNLSSQYTVALFNQALNTYYSSGSQYYFSGYYLVTSSYAYVSSAGSRTYYTASNTYSSGYSVWDLYASNDKFYHGQLNPYDGNTIRCLARSTPS